MLIARFELWLRSLFLPTCRQAVGAVFCMLYHPTQHHGSNSSERLFRECPIKLSNDMWLLWAYHRGFNYRRPVQVWEHGARGSRRGLNREAQEGRSLDMTAAQLSGG